MLRNTLALLPLLCVSCASFLSLDLENEEKPYLYSRTLRGQLLSHGLEAEVRWVHAEVLNELRKAVQEKRIYELDNSEIESFPYLYLKYDFRNRRPASNLPELLSGWQSIWHANYEPGYSREYLILDRPEGSPAFTIYISPGLIKISVFSYQYTGDRYKEEELWRIDDFWIDYDNEESGNRIVLTGSTIFRRSSEPGGQISGTQYSYDLYTREPQYIDRYTVFKDTIEGSLYVIRHDSEPAKIASFSYDIPAKQYSRVILISAAFKKFGPDIPLLSTVDVDGVLKHLYPDIPFEQIQVHLLSDRAVYFYGSKKLLEYMSLGCLNDSSRPCWVAHYVLPEINAYVTTKHRSGPPVSTIHLADRTQTITFTAEELGRLRLEANLHRTLSTTKIDPGLTALMNWYDEEKQKREVPEKRQPITVPSGDSRALVEAIENAGPGAMIVLESGIYFIDHPLKIERKRNLILRGNNRPQIILNRKTAPVIDIQGSQNILLQGISARHVDTPGCMNGVVNIKHSRNIRIEDSELNGSGQFAVEIWFSEYIIVEKSHLHNNSEAAIRIATESPIIRGIVIRENLIENNPVIFYAPVTLKKGYVEFEKNRGQPLVEKQPGKWQ